MKRITAFLLVLCLIVPCVSACAKEQSENFVVISAEVPESIGDKNLWELVARFSDSHQAITLSSYYDGRVYATVPKDDADREIEVFLPDSIPFSDDDGSSYEFFEMKRASKTGLILGNEKGEAKPFDNVTRAEATAVVMRFLGLHTEADYELKFNDVSRNDWFFGYVASAHKAGIVKGDSDEVFSPERNVTREELTVMAARAMDYASLNCMSRSVYTTISDIDTVSDWAKEAYEKVGQCYISDVDGQDPENPVRAFRPQRYATRFDVAYLLNNVATLSQVYPSEVAEQFGFDEKMPIIDGSTSTYPFTEAVYTNLFSNGKAHPSFPEKHSKSHNSYEKLISGEVDMLFASVYPASDILELAKSKGVELELIPIAYDAMIFFTNKDNPATSLTKEQITDIYVNNAYENWAELGYEDAILYPYCRNNDSGSHAQMERHFLNGGDIHPEVKKETSYTMSNILTDVMDAKTDSPKGYGLGYSIYYYFHNMDMFYDTLGNLKLLGVDGVLPTDETIADGTYPLSNNTYVVLRADSPQNSPERKMAEFMLTEAGQHCVEQAGYGRLK